MESLKTLIQIPKKPALKSERAELVKFFVDAINQQRIGTKYKPVTGRHIAIKLSHIPKNDLYYMISTMKDLGGEKAVKWFWYSIRPKDNEPQ